MNLEDTIEYVAETLPKNWIVRLDITNGAVSVFALRPDLTEVPLIDSISHTHQIGHNNLKACRKESPLFRYRLAKYIRATK
jgi:hypothetical protein